jgi:ATP-dependent Clp protease ATP-binding subunit ClpX
VQQALLKIMEGTVSVQHDKAWAQHPQQEFCKLDTTNILLSGGAFAGLDKIIAQRGSGAGWALLKYGPDERGVGEIFNDLEPEDLLKFGLIPNLLPFARDRDAWRRRRRIVTIFVRRRIVKQYQRLFELENAKLTFTDDALVAIAKRALNVKQARGIAIYSRKTSCLTRCLNCPVWTR